MSAWRTTDIAALHRLAGADAMAVAASVGRTPRAVQDKARREGLPAPRMPNDYVWPASTKKRAQAMRGQRMTLSQISRALGVPFGTVRRWVYEPQEQAA